MFGRFNMWLAEKHVSGRALSLHKNLARQLDSQIQGWDDLWIGSPDYLLIKRIPEGYRCLRVLSVEYGNDGRACRVDYQSLYLLRNNRHAACFVSEGSRPLQDSDDVRSVAIYKNEDVLHLLATNPHTPSKDVLNHFIRLIYRCEDKNAF